MDYDAHLDAVEREVGSFATALRAGSARETVPTCPEWSLRDLAVHVGEFTGFWTHVLCEGTGREKTPFPEPPDDPRLADWYQELGEHLVSQLRATPPDTPVWTWVPHDKTARFVARRCANELAIHRFDAQTVSDTTQPVDAPLAADGIEEIFLMVEAWARPADGSGMSLHLHGAEGHEWTIAMAPDGLDVQREHTDADLTLSGAVSDLELQLYQRPPIGDVHQQGDPAALQAWYREFTF